MLFLHPPSLPLLPRNRRQWIPLSEARGEVAEASSLISGQGEVEALYYQTGRLKSDETSILRLSADLTRAISAPTALASSLQLPPNMAPGHPMKVSKSTATLIKSTQICAQM